MNIKSNFYLLNRYCDSLRNKVFFYDQLHNEKTDLVKIVLFCIWKCDNFFFKNHDFEDYKDCFQFLFVHILEVKKRYEKNPKEYDFSFKKQAIFRGKFAFFTFCEKYLSELRFDQKRWIKAYEKKIEEEKEKDKESRFGKNLFGKYHKFLKSNYIALKTYTLKDFYDSHEKNETYYFILEKVFLEKVITKFQKTHPKSALFLQKYLLEFKEEEDIMKEIGYERKVTFYNAKYDSLKLLRRYFNRGFSLENF